MVFDDPVFPETWPTGIPKRSSFWPGFFFAFWPITMGFQLGFSLLPVGICCYPMVIPVELEILSMKDLLQTYFFQGFLCKCGVIFEYGKRFPFEIPGFASLWISMATCS